MSDEGDAAAAAGDFAGAAAAYERALEGAPTDARVLTNLGLCYSRLGRLGDAVRVFERATVHAATLPEAWLNLGVALIAVGDVRRAATVLAEAVKWGENVAAAHAAHATALALSGDVEKSLGAIDRALALCPLDADLRDNKRRILESLGRRNEAEAIAVDATEAERHAVWRSLAPAKAAEAVALHAGQFREFYAAEMGRAFERGVEGIGEVGAFLAEVAPQRALSNDCLFDAGCAVLEALHLQFGGVVTFDDDAAAVVLVVPVAAYQVHVANPIGAVFRVYAGARDALRDEVAAVDRAVSARGAPSR
ncbi:MAG: tetratricopeptide repeat protein [Deltaproteobacteria bacterium]|nr:tetratricopeptide repeat protein [Deltaproteobacteria bacterium]